MKTAFVTVGTTSFDSLVAAMTAPEALQVKLQGGRSGRAGAGLGLRDL